MESVEKFEEVLKQHNSRRPSMLYSINKNITSSFHNKIEQPKDIIRNISAQIKAIQNADSVVKSKSVKKVLDKHKTSSFFPVNMLQTLEVQPKKTTKFETQFVLDTQLMDVIENVEAMSAHKGMTQEFETTFDNNDAKDRQKVPIDSIENSFDKIVDHNPENIHFSENYESNSNNSTKIKIPQPVFVSVSEDVKLTKEHVSPDNKILMDDNCTDLLDQCMEVEENIKINVIPDVDISPSPIINININNGNKSKSTSPLVFDLESFEKFENLAVPFIEENIDIDRVKHLINSQILDKELFLQIDFEPDFLISDERHSPVLKISKTPKLSAERNDETQQFPANNEVKNLDIFHEVKDFEKESSSSPTLDFLSKVKKKIANEQNMNSANLEDEILFSSDEEIDIKHADLKEIPLTCALETSFYEHSDVLDTTMYVGFQTASNKSIQVSAVSFTKAKSILEDETDFSKDFSLKDLVDKCDMNPKVMINDNSVADKCTKDDNITESEEIDLGFDVKRASESDTNFVGFKPENVNPIDILDENIDKNKASSFNDIDTNLLPCKFDGFKTASNKNIHLSEKALTRCKRVFQDIDLDNNFSDEEFLSEFEPCRKKIKLNIEEDGNRNNNNEHEKEICDIDFPKIDEDILQEFEGEMSFDDNIIDNKESNLVGFKSDNNKNSASDSALHSKSEHILNDIDFQDHSPKSGHNADCKEDNNIFEKPNVGFKTASNKSIVISDHALTKTKQVFEDIDIPDFETTFERSNTKYDSIKNHSSFIGFKTASNKDIKVTEDAIAKSKNIFQDIDTLQNNDFLKTDVLLKDAVKHSMPSTSKVCFVGFKTANNNAITISEAALAKSKNVFKDLDVLQSEITHNNNKQCNTTNLNVINILDTEASLRTNKTDKGDTTNTKAVFKGFLTASNKEINVSAQALSRSKKIFDELNTLDDVTVTSNNKDPVFKGFQTARNKQVKISDEALAKSKKIFDDLNLDKETEKDQATNTVSTFKGFQTASNKKVKISDEALAKSKKIFEELNIVDEEMEVIPNKTGPVFKGFQTASNKEVKISDEALAKSKKIFDDLNFVDRETENDQPINTRPTFKGFHTASNKEVKISAEALAEGRKLFEDSERNNNTTEITNFSVQSNKQNSCFVGFQTASNKKVKISAEALEKSKNVFKDLNVVEESNLDNAQNNTTPFFGFQTANNKEVKVSSEALANSKKLLEQSQSGDDCTKIKTVLHETSKQNRSPTVFRGFQTAANKEVKISAEALAKSRKIFVDLSGFKENSCDHENIAHSVNFEGGSNMNVIISEESKQILSDIKTNDSKNHIFNPAFSFKTANNNNINISEEALLKSKNIFAELNENEDKTSKSGVINKINKDNENNKDTKFYFNVDRLIDTQVINNFDESLNTEDFRSPENRSKRSGSPILSCPKAKKRKFATPYKKDTLKQKPESVSAKIDIHDDNYKKNKVYTLKDIEKLEKDNTGHEITTDLDLNNINIDNFEFKGKRNDISDLNISVDDLKHHFLKAVNKKLVPDGWFENHVKMIIWKMLSYEIKFPKTMSGVCSAKNVLAQMKYRYFKELYNAERPALRKILERDDVASKTLILCVMDVFNDRDEKSGTNTTELLLTDGWYSVRASIDKMLVKYVSDGKIRIGGKIATHGAELVNCEQGVAPWEDTSSIRLKIFGNSTRRARWDARLGYHGNGAILSQLSTVKPEGGKVSKLRVIVTRVYPALYVEKFEDGSTVTRSERLEHIHQAKYEAERQALVEKVYEEVEKEMSDEDSPDTEDIDVKRSLDSGSQIARMLKMSKEPSQFRSSLTESQRRLLSAYTASKQEEILQKIQDKVLKRLSSTTRNVVPLMKIRVAEGGGGKALLSIWKPNDALSELLIEGATIDILNVVPTAVRHSELQLSAGRQTIFKPTDKKTQEIMQPYIKSLGRICYPIKEIVQHPSMMTDYNEIDTVGLVIQIDPSHKDFKITHQFQNAYLTDENKNIICLNFWGGIKKFGFENVLDTGQVVACVNLQKRVGNTRKNIPHYRATEFTYFTKTPKNVNAKILVDDLEKEVQKNKGFLDECLAVKNRLLKNYTSNENVSPYRFQNHDLSKNKIYIESPLARGKKDEFNLSGLDFESTFRQTEPQELSPKALLRKKKVNDRISKLKMYGEPPPLSPLNIINKSKDTTKSYKSPLLNTSVASKTPVASVKKLPESTGNDLSCSPVLSVNRTFKKGVPVKLNFNNVAIDENDSVDHFAEEFDPSPPLSLD